MHRPQTYVLILALVALTGCDSESAAPQDPKPPYTESKASDNLIKLEFNHVEPDPVNRAMPNYAKAIREWTLANPEKKIVTIMGIPIFSSGKGLTAVWIKTAAKAPGEIQRVIQLDLPSELPEEFTIATLYFDSGQPAGIIGLTP